MMLLEHTISTLGATPLIERHYDSQKTLAHYVLQSHVASSLEPGDVGAPLWRQYAQDSGAPVDVTLDSGLTRIIPRLLGQIDPQCQEAMASVHAIAKAIQQRLRIPPGADVHRKRTMGRSGYALNIHKVNRGQLGTAWKRTLREHVLRETGVVTIVLCTDYTASAVSVTAQYTIGATLALAQAIEATGRRVEIWASILTHNAHRMRRRFLSDTADLVPGCPATFDELDHLVVKRADEPITSPAVAALCSLDLVRSLFFQVWRMQRETIGTLHNYGAATNKADVYQRLLPYLTRQGIAPSSVLMGADETDHIRSLETAVAWAQRQLTTVTQ